MESREYILTRIYTILNPEDVQTSILSGQKIIYHIFFSSTKDLSTLNSKIDNFSDDLTIEFEERKIESCDDMLCLSIQENKRRSRLSENQRNLTSFR